MITRPDGTKLAYVGGLHVDVALITDAFFAGLRDVLQSEMNGTERSPLTQFFHVVMSESYSPEDMAELINKFAAEQDKNVNEADEVTASPGDHVTEPAPKLECDLPAELTESPSDDVERDEIIGLTPLDGGGFALHHVNGVYVGDVLCKEDGFYDFWPNLNGGYWSQAMMLEIGDLLEELNAPYERLIAKDPALGASYGGTT